MNPLSLKIQFNLFSYCDLFIFKFITRTQLFSYEIYVNIQLYNYELVVSANYLITHSHTHTHTTQDRSYDINSTNEEWTNVKYFKFYIFTKEYLYI